MKSTILILHGWATTMSGSRYSELTALLASDGHTVFAPDLPGFGREKLQKPVMVLDDYVSFVDAFLKKKKIKKAIIIGHSFGGRIAAKFAATHPEKVEKLVLTGAPLIKRKLTAKKRVAFLVAKSGKAALSFFPASFQTIGKKLLYRSIGEWDYYKANELKATMQAIIREDLFPLLPNIHTPTLVVWGENDTFVPLGDGKEITKHIKYAKFVSIPQATHKLPYEYPEKFFQAAKSFLR